MTRVIESGLPRLLINLKKLKEYPNLDRFFEEGEDGKFFLHETSDLFKDTAPEDLKELLSEVLEDLDEWMIADNGYHHIPNRDYMKTQGYSFEKGEEDEFGPVTSVIVVGDFRIVYG